MQFKLKIIPTLFLMTLAAIPVSADVLLQDTGDGVTHPGIDHAFSVSTVHSADVFNPVIDNLVIPIEDPSNTFDLYYVNSNNVKTPLTTICDAKHIDELAVKEYHFLDGIYALNWLPERTSDIPVDFYELAQSVVDSANASQQHSIGQVGINYYRTEKLVESLNCYKHLIENFVFTKIDSISSEANKNLEELVTANSILDAKVSTVESKISTQAAELSQAKYKILNYETKIKRKNRRIKTLKRKIKTLEK